MQGEINVKHIRTTLWDLRTIFSAVLEKAFPTSVHQAEPYLEQFNDHVDMLYEKITLMTQELNRK